MQAANATRRPQDIEVRQGYVIETMESLSTLAALVVEPPPAVNTLSDSAGRHGRIDELLGSLEHASALEYLPGLAFLFHALRRQGPVWPQGLATAEQRLALSEWVSDVCTYLLGGGQQSSALAAVHGLTRLEWIKPLETPVCDLITAALINDAPRLQSRSAATPTEQLAPDGSGSRIVVLADMARRRNAAPAAAPPTSWAGIALALEMQLLPAVSAALETQDEDGVAPLPAVQACVQQFQPLAAAVDALALRPLQQLCAGYARLLQQLCGLPRLDLDDAYALGMWPLLLIEYLRSPHNAGVVDDLIALLLPQGQLRDPAALRQALLQLSPTPVEPAATA